MICSAFSSSVVFVDAFDLTVEIVSGRRSPQVVFTRSTKRTLAARLHRGTCRGTRVVGQRTQLFQLGEIGHPASPIAPVIMRARPGFVSNSQRRGVTPLVLLLKRSG